MRTLSARAKAARKAKTAQRKITLPKPLPHQVELLRDEHRHKRAVCGRRWGKTGAGLLAAVVGHGHPDRSHPGHLKGALDGGNIWWVAPTFVIALKIERDVCKAFALSGFDYHKSEKRIEIDGGGSVTIKTAASEASLRGDSLDGVVYDEPAFSSESAWKEALRPALSDRQGWSLFTTTPNGLNWIKDQFDMSATNATYKGFQLPSSQNPLMTPDELAVALEEVGQRVFAQEYLAQFVDIEGAEFSGYYFQFPGFWFDDYPPESEVVFRVIGLDPSKGKTDKSDYQAFVMATLYRDGHIYVDADMDRRDLSTLADRAVDLAAIVKPHGMIVEINQFQELLLPLMRPALVARGLELNIFPTNNTANKISRIRSTLTPFLSRGELHFRNGSPGARLLVKQLQEFPTGKHDDGPDALEMAIRLLRHLRDGGAI